VDEQRNTKNDRRRNDQRNADQRNQARFVQDPSRHQEREFAQCDEDGGELKRNWD
jgi:hypothetical protein